MSFWSSKVASLFTKAKRARLRSSVQKKRAFLMESLENRSLFAGDISGNIFNDANANGVEDLGESGIAGWTVFVDTNGDGALGAGEASAVTDVKGKWAILGVPAGDVTVYEVLQPGFTPSPGFSDHQLVNVRDGREARIKFPNTTAAPSTGAVTGTVFEDVNENGIKEPGEHGLQAWTMYVDANGDGILNAGENSTTTDADGNYRLAGLAAGNATIYEIPQGGLMPTVGGLFPTDGALDHHQVTITAGSSVRSDFANLMPQIGTIRGAVVSDANGDGLLGASDAGIAGRTVFVDLNANGAQDPGEPARVTDANGAYSFNNIHTGSYRVTEALPSGWIAADGKASSVFTAVFRGSNNQVDFYDLIPTTGSISGVVWEDGDGNGLMSVSEQGLAGWQVFIDGNGNGSLDAGESQAVTDVIGAYRFDAVPYGNVTLREAAPANWMGTNPASGAITLHLLNGENRAGVNFGNREKVGTIQGTIWNDANGDRLRNAEETGLANWTVYLDLNNNGAEDADEPQAVSDASGAYQFTRVPSGVYHVNEVMPDGWTASLGKPTSLTATVVTGGVQTADYYNLVPVAGSISGTVFSDLDSNGIQTAGEAGLAGWQVFVDLNASGTLDVGEPNAVSDTTGAYTISDVAYGNVTVQEVFQPGFTATNPVTGKTSLFLLNGENRAPVAFANHEATDYSISGAAFFDANGNGVRDLGEQGLSGITVYLDANNNGQLDAGEQSVATSADLFFTPSVNELGNYSFTHLARGTYHVREILPPELSATPVANQELAIAIGPASQADANFANVYRANEIHGVSFDDKNADGLYDNVDSPRSGRTVYLDLNRDNVRQADEPYTLSADDGSYAFVTLTPGAYIVREEGSEPGSYSYPATGGGILWPVGVDHPAVGNVTPRSINTSLANGDSYLQTVSLTLPNSGSLSNMVDVFLLFDDTGSFTANSPIVRAAFPDIINTLQAALPGTDFGFGVGRFEEYANFASEFATGRPFILNQPIVASSTPGFSTSIQSALDRTAPGYGGDQPETDIEALYQLVTGLGFDGNNNGTVSDSGAAGLAATQLNPGASGDVPSFASFTADPANNVLSPSGHLGGGGFRPGALPIILTATDTGFAYQPKGETSITGTGGLTLPLSALTQTSRATTPFNSGAGLQDTVTALNALGALVVGLGTNAEATLDPRQGLESLAKLTGAVNQSTTTIGNGTADTIAPGDPLYFQISSGFGTTVADGIVNAIQNAVTNVAMDIELRSSDPSVKIINHTGALTGIGSGQTATFDVEFVGDGRPHRFDLQFVRAGTNVVLGSIPVTLGTPVVGEGYEYEDLHEGEIHHSSNFGHYVANTAPSFVAGADVAIAEDAGLQTVPTWATSISAGPASEAGQTLNFLVANSNPALFATQPTIAPDGTLSFTPAPNANGTATVTVQLHDNGGIGLGGSDTSAPQTFLITVTPVNDAPVAADDAFATDSATKLTSPAGSLLANDSDVDGDALSARLVTPPAHGTVVVNSDGSFEYVPAIGFAGADSFTYLANDGTVDSNIATVNITVNRLNHAPIAGDDAFTTSEDTALTVGLPGLVANDSDVDGDTVTAVLLSVPTHGTLTLNADGSFVYIPAANYNGSDSFTYKLSDGTAASNVATVTLSVSAANDAPLSASDAFTTREDSPLNSLMSVLGNDSDAEGDPLTAMLVSGPAHGTLTLNPDGTFQYVPAANFNGTDRFTYQASDGSLLSNLATVTITVTPVNDAPVATGESYTTNEDTPLNVAAPGLLANDTDIDGDILRAILAAAPAHGTLALNPNGSFVYTPAANFNGADSFTYKVNDGLLDSNAVTVTLTVAGVNDAPVGANDSYSTKQNVALNVPVAGVLANDSDVDGDKLSAVVVALPTHGSLMLNADGSFAYTPAAGYAGPDSFTYRASDGLLSSGLATVSITVTAPPAPGAKFFVVDDGSQATFKYAADGAPIANNALNKSDSKPRGIASNATGTTQWIIDLSGTVFVYDNNGGMLGQWQPQNVGKPEGIAVWGNDLWIVDPNSDRVYSFSGGANLRAGKVNPTSSFALNSGNLNSTDLVTDGSHLWVVNDTTTVDKVFRYTTAGTLEGNWTISTSNPSPSGITLDPNNVNHLWIVDASTDRVYQYDGATSRLAGSQEPGLTFTLAAGDTSPQGIADPLDLPAADSAATVSTALAPVSNSLQWHEAAHHRLATPAAPKAANLLARPDRVLESDGWRRERGLDDLLPMSIADAHHEQHFHLQSVDELFTHFDLFWN